MRQLRRYTALNGLVAILLLLVFAVLSMERFRAAAVSQTQNDLATSLRIFRLLLAQKGDGFRVADGKLWVGNYPINGNFEVPDKVRELTGDTATIFMGDQRVSTNITQPDGTRAVGTRLEGAARRVLLQEGKPFHGEAPILGVPYLTAYEPIRDGSGKVVGALYVGVKKSEFLAHFNLLRGELFLIMLGLVALFIAQMILVNSLVREADERRESDLAFLQTLIDSIPNPIFYKDAAGRFLGCNNAYQQFIGLDRGQVIGKTVRDIAPRELAELYEQADRELFDRKEVQVYESTVWDATGAAHEVLFSKAIFPGPDGAPAGLIGTLLDITERRAAEEKLRRFSQAVEQSAASIVITDTRGTIEYVNPSFCRITGYSREEAVGHNPRVLKSGRTAPEVYGELWGTVTSGREWQGEFYNRKKNGDFFWESARISPITDAAGVVTGYLAIKEDITARKKAEEDVRRLNEELERKVRERTAALLEAQDELVRKEKLAILGQLSGSVGHELRNPLGVMNNAVYYLKMVIPEADRTTREYLDIIKSEIDNSQRIITDLLDFARTSPPRSRPTAVRQLVDETLAKCRLPSSVEVCDELPADLPLLKVDPLQAGQVLHNLVTNAVQAMEAGGVLKIGARPAGGFVEISVADTGEGIPAEHLERVFQPLFTTKAKGIGLGLVVSKNLTEANGGSIRVLSRQGEGTVFTVALPMEV